MSNAVSNAGSSSRTVLVTGATGGQGGAVARSLIENGWTVRALVRDPDSEGAKSLEVRGAELAVGDLGDQDSLRAAADGVHGVFSVQPADLTAPRPEVEVEQGKNVADAARGAGVAHLVYSSVGAAGRDSRVQHFETKTELEEYVVGVGVPTTVVRPVFFMENWAYMMPQAQDGERVGSIALDADTPLQMIALDDIGRIVAEVFGAPDEFMGTRVDIAGDELTVREIAETFAAADGIPTRLERQPIEQLRAASGELANMFDWLGSQGYQADVAALRERHPGLLSLEDWLTRDR